MAAGTALRVALLTHYLSRNGGGVFEVVTRLLAHLSAQPGLAMNLLGLADADSAADLAAAGVLGARACPVRGPAAIGFAPALPKALTAATPQVLHVHGLWMYPSVLSLRWLRRGGPVLISPHGMLDPWAVRNSRWKKRLAGVLFEYRHLRRAACLHALCRPEAEAIRGFGLQNPVAVIPNGVDIPPPDTAAQPPPWAGLVPAGARVLLYLGRLHPKKNLAALLQAWQRLEAESGPGADWWLVVAGWDQGGHRAELAALSEALGLRRCCLLAPQHGAGKDAAYRQADAFVLPSVSEGLPMTVLEAWAYGRPVLMTRACNLAEGFAAGAALEAGTDADALYGGLVELTGLSESARTAMGAAGLALVQRSYSWPRVAEHFAELYRWLHGDGPRPAEVLDDGGG